MQIDLYKLHANICKTLAHPKRLQIIYLIGNKECSASALLKELEISKANLSQHMKLLSEKGVVIAEKRGLQVIYKLSDEKITKACNLMREVLVNKIKAESKVFVNN